MTFEFHQHPPESIIEFRQASISTVVQARSTEGPYQVATVSAHLGKAPYWFFEMETNSFTTTYPRDQRFMPLVDALRTFEAETGLTLPAIDLYRLDGVHRYENGVATLTDARNPLEIVPGREYDFPFMTGQINFVDGLYVGVQGKNGPGLVSADRVNDPNLLLKDHLTVHNLSRQQLFTLVQINRSHEAAGEDYVDQEQSAPRREKP